MDLHVRQVVFKALSNGYVVNYAQQTNQVATQEEAVFNTLGQVEAHIKKLDEVHTEKVRELKKSQENAPDSKLVEVKDGN
jgi:hypothetical protein